MPTNILMPALSPTMEKGNLARWLKKEGDKIKSGDIIAEIETDKATMEYEAVDEGTLAKIVVPEGTKDANVDLNRIEGSGPHGRVIARDIDAAKSGKGLRAPGATPAAAPMTTSPSDAQVRALYEDGSYDFVPHDQMRKIIAQRLTLSKQTIPHFYLTLDCDIGKLMTAREEINAAA